MDTHQQAEVEEEEGGMAGQAVAVAAAATVATGMGRVVLSAEHCLSCPSPVMYCHTVKLTA